MHGWWRERWAQRSDKGQRVPMVQIQMDGTDARPERGCDSLLQRTGDVLVLPPMNLGARNFRVFALWFAIHGSGHPGSIHGVGRNPSAR